MTEIVKHLNGVWFLAAFVGGTIYGYAILNNDVEYLKSDSKIKTDQIQRLSDRLEKQDLTLTKIQVDVSYVRALLEKQK